MTTVFTDAGKGAGFIIQRGQPGFEAFAAALRRALDVAHEGLE
jgi:hypothetical protein